MFASLVRRSATNTSPINLRNSSRISLAGTYTSRYKPKKIWPPDFSKLSQKEQFRFEKKYKRRVKLATARPRWDKYVKMAQLVTVTGECVMSSILFLFCPGLNSVELGVLVYSVLFMDWNTEHQPFQGVSSAIPVHTPSTCSDWSPKLRDRFWGAMESFSPSKRHERRNVE
jgi:hypothetical protein